jgi:hypothetical protein
MNKVYVRFWKTGFFVSDDWDIEIVSRDVKFEIPAYVYAYQIFERRCVEVDGETLLGKRIMKSEMHYLNGVDYSLEQVKEHFPQNTTLIRNMEGNKWNRMFRTQDDKWFPIDELDVVDYE